MEYHKPVLLEEVIDILEPVRDSQFVDCTLGNGGHTEALLNHGSRVYGIEQDPKNLELSQARLSQLANYSNFSPILGNFSHLLEYINKYKITPLSGVLFDLGISSNQQKQVGRGFSFNDTESLDMRLDPTSQSLTAEEIINTYPYDSLYEIFSHHAQEVYSKPLAIQIIKQRQKKPIKTGSELAAIIKNYYSQHGKKSKHDPATKIFMALRIVVNEEFTNLKNILTDTLSLPPKTKVVFISFHSGEDRLVKNFIRQNHQRGIISQIRPAITPSYKETKDNPLARSAVLRSYRIN